MSMQRKSRPSPPRACRSSRAIPGRRSDATPGTVAKLSATVRGIARSPDVATRMRDLGYEIVASDPGQLATIQREETRRWGEVIRRAGIRPET